MREATALVLVPVLIEDALLLFWKAQEPCRVLEALLPSLFLEMNQNSGWAQLKLTDQEKLFGRGRVRQ